MKLYVSEPAERSAGPILICDQDHNDIAELFHTECHTVPQSYETALALAKTICGEAPIADAPTRPDPADATDAMQPETGPVDWLWFGNGKVTFGRWARFPGQYRYKLAEIQPTEHDHPASGPALSARFEQIIKSLNYDGNDTDSLTVGEIRRALS